MNAATLAKMLASEDKRDVIIAVDILHTLGEEEYKHMFWKIHSCYNNGIFASRSWFFEIWIESDMWKPNLQIYLKIPTNENKILVYL